MLAFVDDQTRQPYQVTTDCRAFNAALKHGQTRRLVFTLLDYDRVDVRSEPLRPAP